MLILLIYNANRNQVYFVKNDYYYTNIILFRLMNSNYKKKQSTQIVRLFQGWTWGSR